MMLKNRKRIKSKKTKRKDLVSINSYKRDPYIDYEYIEKVNREVFALIGDVPQMAPAMAETTAQLVKK
jgi:hypothetical protein